MVTHQLQVERRTGKVQRSKTNVLLLCHATCMLILPQQSSHINKTALFYTFSSPNQQ